MAGFVSFPGAAEIDESPELLAWRERTAQRIADREFREQDETAGPEPITIRHARALGLTEEQIDHLLCAGLIQREMWVPQDLDGVNWAAGKLLSARERREHLVEQHERRLRQVDAEIAWWENRIDCAQELVWDALPRKKDGTPARLSLDLDTCRFQFRRKSGGRKLVDDEAFLAQLKQAVETSGYQSLEADFLPVIDQALRVEVRETGRMALLLLQRGEGKPTLLKTPIQKWLESLPDAVDTETGEVLPPALPAGCEVVPDSRTWSIE